MVLLLFHAKQSPYHPLLGSCRCPAACCTFEHSDILTCDCHRGSWRSEGMSKVPVPGSTMRV
ncbi:hypothetical protein HETIRDRAFT_164357 [Heterobasidion irregulare TC 32-1]|uniref:Uncharacterized protein n=1 Tax=Heterobasidion irregulare (strain TC 32-1) TaxID=747525 RepID=W4JRL8_HETIT|nr:uncharacterized protein HETIRDRAFT_164357 [Heterobasidion irregulare TC 32-1]ETW75516.1 hypothetical protein HETIRDRAFT_164357 [Heterobasidion irregulare TC 32-1]